MRVAVRAGLTLLGLLLGVAAGSAKAAEPKPAKRIAIAVTEDRFDPKRVTVPRDEDVILVFTRRTERTCAKKVAAYTADDSKIERELPLNVAVEIKTKFKSAGELGYVCGMGHLAGTIIIR